MAITQQSPKLLKNKHRFGITRIFEIKNMHVCLNFEQKTKLFTGQTMTAGFWLLKLPSLTNIV